MAIPFLRDFTNGAEQGCDVDILVQPRASKTEVAGVHDDRLKIRLAAPPVDGAANSELIRFMADALNLPKRQVRIQSGETGRRKKIRIFGITSDHLQNTFGLH